MNFISYAQNYEDVMLWRSLKHIEKGFYIDVGANDPVQDSLTKAFYDRGWNGINIEPVGEWFEKLCLNRPRDINLQVAAGDHDGDLSLFEIVGTGLSTANKDYAKRHAEDQGYQVRELIVPVQTLTSILLEHNISDIHFLKIDVEGGEEAVLKGLDLSAIRPWIILIEATQPQTEVLDYQRWEFILLEKNYQFVYFDGLNRFYVADEHSYLSSTFSSPPNPWDRYERAGEYEARQQVKALATQLEAKKAELQLRLDELKAQQAISQSLNLSLEDVYNGRSMKITAPLRKMSQLQKKLKSLPKRLARKAIFVVVSQPRLRRIAKPIADKYPKLQYRLSCFLHGNSRSNVTNFESTTITNLSSRSARILKDLQQITRR